MDWKFFMQIRVRNKLVFSDRNQAGREVLAKRDLMRKLLSRKKASSVSNDSEDGIRKQVASFGKENGLGLGSGKRGGHDTPLHASIASLEIANNTTEALSTVAGIGIATQEQTLNPLRDSSAATIAASLNTNKKTSGGGGVRGLALPTNFTQNFQIAEIGAVDPSKIQFRHKLFIIYCLASFKSPEETQSLFQKQFHKEVSMKAVKLCLTWMKKFDAEPEMELRKKDTTWKELWLQYCEHRKNYLGNLRDVPLAHVRVRMEELTRLYEEVQPRTSKVLSYEEHATDENGNLLYFKNGKPKVEKKVKFVVERDIPTAAMLLKQIGQEAGSSYDKTEVNITLVDRIKAKRKERGLDGIAEADYSEIANYTIPKTQIPLPPPPVEVG